MSPVTLNPLVDVSARIGAERLLIQGAGGNTSLKSDDDIWVKASGRWLADAALDDLAWCWRGDAEAGSSRRRGAGPL